jgi:uncharacterized protein (DUF1330 family)
MAGALVKGGAIQDARRSSLSRLVIEFPSVEAAATFYDSPEYQAISRSGRPMQATLCIVEGVGEGTCRLFPSPFILGD